MFVRTTRIKRGKKTYEYQQLVESYRQENGKPTHRVIISLKDWRPETIQALKLALDAARKGKVLICAKPTHQAPASKHKVLDNLAYLPVAVLREMWKHWHLAELLDSLLPSASTCAHSQIIEALVLHRCVAPGSKLAACTWYPTTALPELLGVEAPQMNNSRVHRALHALVEVEESLQVELARRIGETSDGVRVTFLDLTDTWFVGRGPALSRKGKTKEGLYREKVGIALLCDQRGYPLKWQTVEGGRYEANVMLELLRKAVDDGTLTGQPVVMDRAMGNGVHLEEMSEAGVSFVTMLVRNEYGSFVKDGLWEKFGPVELACSEQTHEVEVKRLSDRAVELGMTPMADGRFVWDADVAPCKLKESKEPQHGPIAQAMREVNFMTEALASGAAPTVSTLAGWYDTNRVTIYRYRKLGKLEEEVRDRVLQGDAESLRITELGEIGVLPAPEQMRAFEAKLAWAESQERSQQSWPKILQCRQDHMLLRRVVWFSPELLIRRQRTARDQLQQVRARVATLNEAQRARVRPWSEVMMLASARAMLKSLHWLNLFDVTTTVRRSRGREHHELVLTLDEEEWTRRRAMDGFGVIVAAPTVLRTASELVQLYFDKDVVEKDFQLIKSELELRPVRHQTDAKVQAHVSLCMLALLLERTLEQQLAKGGAPLTAAAALSTLSTCHLNRLETEGVGTYYTITQPTHQQQELLAALDHPDLLDDAQTVASLKPR